VNEPKEVKIFDASGDDAELAVAVIANQPNKICLVAQVDGQRRVILLPDSSITLAELARSICEVGGITKIHHKKKAGYFDISIGPKPKRPDAWSEEG